MSEETLQLGTFIVVAAALMFLVFNVRGCNETEAHYRAERYKVCIAAGNTPRDCQ